MRQVINKLIREEDLYGAVDAAYSQGWRADEALLPHRPAHRDRRGHPRHRRAGPQLRRDRQDATRAGRRSRCRVGGFVPKPHTPFQWFGQNTVAELRRKIGLLRDATAKARGVQLKWHDPQGDAGRGHRQPRRPPHRRRCIERRVARRRHLPGVERALRPRPLGRRHGAPTACRSTGTSTATAPRTRCCPGTTSRPASTSDFLWQDWQRRPGRARRSRTAGGRPATTAARAPATASSTSWPRPMPPAGGSQGTGQDLRPAARCPCALPAPAAPSRCGCRRAGPRPVRQAGQGPLDQPPRRGPHVGAGPAPGRAAGGLHRGLLAPAQAALRAGPVRPATSRSASTSTSTSPAAELDVGVAGLPELAHARRCPSGIDVHGRASSSTARRAVAAAGRHRAARGGSSVAGVDRRRGRRRRSAAALAGRRRSWSPAAARATTSPTTSGPPSSTSPSPARRRRRRCQPRRRRSATQPRGLRPGELLAVVLAGRRARRTGAAHPPMDRARRRPPEPLPARRRRRRRTPAERAHEKGTPSMTEPCPATPAPSRTAARRARRPSRRGAARAVASRAAPVRGRGRAVAAAGRRGERAAAGGEPAAERRRRAGDAPARPASRRADRHRTAVGRRPPTSAGAAEAGSAPSTPATPPPRPTDDDRQPELPDRPIEGKVQSPEVAERALVRRPQIGDSRPAPRADVAEPPRPRRGQAGARRAGRRSGRERRRRRRRSRGGGSGGPPRSAPVVTPSPSTRPSSSTRRRSSGAGAGSARAGPSAAT